MYLFSQKSYNLKEIVNYIEEESEDDATNYDSDEDNSVNNSSILHIIHPSSSS